MTVAIELHLTIGATPERVWEELEDLESHTEWMADAESIEFRTGQRQGVGTEMECLTRIGPFSTLDILRVVEWEPGAAMAIEHRGVVTGTGRFTLRPAARGMTELAWREELRFPWWMGGPAGERAAAPILRRVWRANLAHFRARCEALGRNSGP